MKKITESELKNKVSRLREYLTVLEAGYVGPGTPPGTGQKGPTVAAAQGKDPSNPLNQVKPQDSLSPGEQIVPPATQSAKPAPAAPAGAWPTDVNAIKAFQKANGLTADGLIGRKTYTALTQQGLKPPVGFGIATNKPPAPPTAQNTKPAPAKPELRTPAEIAASADLLTANDGSGQNGGADQARNPNAGLTPDDPRWQGPKPTTPAPTAPTSTQVQTDDEGNHMITTPDGKTVVVGADGKPLPNGGKVTPAAAPAAPPAAPPATPAKAADGGPAPTPEQLKWLGGADKNDPYILARMRKAVPNAPAAAPAPAPTATAGTPPPTTESVGFQNDELSRIVSLVHHR
jgi:hypothetical protein